jgi:hypothetical protein
MLPTLFAKYRNKQKHLIMPLFCKKMANFFVQKAVKIAELTVANLQLLSMIEFCKPLFSSSLDKSRKKS